MNSKILIVLIVAIASFAFMAAAVAPTTTTTGVTFTTTKTGFQTVTWDFTAASDGTASVRTPFACYGMPGFAYLKPVGAAWTNTATVTVKPVVGNLLIDRDIYGGAITCAGNSSIIEAFPASYPGQYATDLQFNVTGANSGSLGTSGQFILFLQPGW
jgi:hypothetical protein